MKKYFPSGILICMATLFFAQCSYAQHSANFFEDNRSASGIKKKNVYNFDKRSFPTSHLSEINIKAVRNFARLYKGVEHTHWYNVDNGLIVYFTENGIKGRANYDSDGKWLSTMRAYAEEYLPKDIRAQVKREYYDFSITWVNEITNEKQLYYIVHMQDNSSWKNVMVYDGEMTVVEDRVKQ